MNQPPSEEASKKLPLGKGEVEEVSPDQNTDKWTSLGNMRKASVPIPPLPTQPGITQESQESMAARQRLQDAVEGIIQNPKPRYKHIQPQEET